jgi:hypothetical protein
MKKAYDADGFPKSIQAVSNSTNSALAAKSSSSGSHTNEAISTKM